MIRMAAVTVFLQYLIYIPYSDLLPNGLLRFYNVHYFTWTFPILMLLGIGFLLQLGRDLGALRWRAWPAQFLVLIVAVLLWRADVKASAITEGAVSVPEEQTIAIDFGAPVPMDFVDLSGVQGSDHDAYFGHHRLTVDGSEFKIISAFRVVSTETGVRIIFPRSVRARSLLLTLDPPDELVAEAVSARAGKAIFSLTCRFRNTCALPSLEPPRPFLDNGSSVAFSTPESDVFVHGPWRSSESWGRWSTAVDASVEFRRHDRSPFELSATVQSMISPDHPRETATVLVNGCRVGSADFVFPEINEPRTISGTVPADCIPANGAISVDLRASDVVTAQQVGLGSDTTPIGLGLLDRRTLTADLQKLAARAVCAQSGTDWMKDRRHAMQAPDGGGRRARAGPLPVRSHPRETTLRLAQHRPVFRSIKTFLLAITSFHRKLTLVHLSSNYGGLGN